MATTRLLSVIVTEICTRLNDSSLVKYADSTTYLGRASNYFFITIREMLENPRSYGMKELDYRGVLEREEVVVGGVTETGIILYSDLTAIPSKVIDLYTNSDSANDQLGFNIVKINDEYPAFLENIDVKNVNFYDPKIDSDVDRGWYEIETGIQLYPKASTGLGVNYVTVKYIPDASPDDYTKDTEFYIGGTAGLYTLKFIDKAIDITTNKLLMERNI